MKKKKKKKKEKKQMAALIVIVIIVLQTRQTGADRSTKRGQKAEGRQTEEDKHVTQEVRNRPKQTRPE